MRIYFENPVGRLIEHPHGYALIQYAAGPRDFATFQAFLTHTSQLLRRHGWNKMLADQRQISPFTEEERQWIQEYWLARHESADHALYGAVIIPSDVFARLSVNLVLNDSQHAALTFRMFEEETEAVLWLTQLP
jgi:hypothetical protein